ncbi:hypothetical protein FKZ61_005640 [Litorilinea aerophila]|uniref:Uncharacterized protein n=1 Tax=Litorilinea aerophila TaxID=1204385 RepID=A0A540VIY8_9CHLR|nr:DUF6772 family protein [Litorilinea aerophila]MCC9075593.1 hypothetical protein [Litorilinea aerophila]
MNSNTRQALLRADPHLSRFDPLSRIIVYDDFDHGLQGWTGLIGNYEESLDAMLPPYRELRDPMLSNLTVWDSGTDGSFNGTYALKLATLPRPGALAVAIKRLTFRQLGPIRLETYFTFKPEASELRLSETDVRSFGVLFDLQHGDRHPAPRERVMPHLRYLNALDGQAVARWQFKRRREPMADIGGSGKTRSHFHLAPEGWEDIPDGEQLLCYNEIATKHNWHYLRVDFDLTSMSFQGIRCNDRTFDVSPLEPMRLPAMANLWCMLNLVFWVETDRAKRAFLYLDSVLLSGEWD